jgi:DNA invertase Pin-like site-specific DNA recombinase
MKVALYVRVSTNDQSTEMQKRELAEFIAARGWEVVHTYEDAGHSGAKASRPSLNQMMDDARKRKFKAVVVWKFDRFARSLKHLVTALEEFNELGIDFVSYKENADTTTSMGKAMFGMIGVMAQFERDMIRERVMAGLKNAKAKGKKLGPKITVNDLTKARIRDMRAQHNMSMAKIAAELDVSVGTVHAVLKESRSAS